MTLEELRKEIDAIDDKIAELYGKRMETVKNIGLVKASKGLTIFDAGREKEVVNRVTAKILPELGVYAKQLFNVIFDTSKAYQSRFSNISSPIGEAIKAAVKERQVFPERATVACQGAAGAFSHIAAEKIFELSDITYFKTFEGVFNAVQSGLCQFGALPIENSSVGSVNQVYDLMKKYKFYIVKSVKLKVRHCLLAKNGASLADIKEIVSHEQALGQCGEFLKKLGDVKITATENTAAAARLVAESTRNDIAAVSSKQSAEYYGLKTLASDIQNAENNFTRFICISKSLKIFRGANKISVMANLPHEAGSLHKILSKFNTLGLNLTKLESRPLPNTDFEFMFYFDFEADVEREDVLNLICELDRASSEFRFLGSYNEII
jgi:Prephenate dehydratase